MTQTPSPTPVLIAGGKVAKRWPQDVSIAYAITDYERNIAYYRGRYGSGLHFIALEHRTYTVEETYEVHL